MVEDEKSLRANPPSSRNSDPAHTPKTGTSGRKWLTFGFLGLLAVLGVIIVLAPTILSTSMGRNLVVGAINKTMRGSVTMSALSFSWFGGQNLRGMTILDAAGKTVGRLEHLSTELTLVDVIRGKLNLGQTTIRGLSADLIVEESGANNLNQALEATEPSASGSISLSIPLTGNIELSDARVSVTAPNIEPVAFEGLTGALRVEPGERTLNISLNGHSRQGARTGEFNMTGQVLGLIAPDGVLTPQNANGSVELSAKDLPIDGIDGMLGLHGLLSAVVGESANVNIQASGTADAQELIVGADSPYTRTEISAQLKQDRLTLTQPATVELLVNPALFLALTKPTEGEATLRLIEAFPMGLNIERLDLSMSDLNPGGMALRGSFEVRKPIQLAGTPELGEVTIRNLQAAVESERLAEKISFALDGEAVTRNKPGKLNIQGTLDRVIDRHGNLQLDKMRANLEVIFAGIPTVLIDQLAGQSGQLVDLLGSEMNLSTVLKSSESNRIDGALSVDAGQFRAKDVTFSMTDSIVLTEPAEFHYVLSPKVAGGLLGKETEFGLQRPAELVLRVESFSAPRAKPGEPVFQPAKTKIQGSLVSDLLTVSGMPGLDALHIAKARFDLSGDSLASIRLNGSAQVSEAGNGVLEELNASPLQIAIDSTTSLDTDGHLGLIGTHLRLSSAGMNGEIKANVSPDFSRVTITEPSSLGLNITSNLLRQLGLIAPNQTTLGKPAVVQIGLSQLDLPLATFSLADLSADATARAETLILSGAESAQTTLRNIDIAINYDGEGNSAVVEFAADATSPRTQKTGTLKLDAKLSHLLRNGELSLTTTGIDAQIKIESLPTALLDSLSGQRVLVPMLGDVITADADVKRAKGSAEHNIVELNVQSQNLTADAGFKFGDELALRRAAKVQFTLTPDGYAAMTGTPPATVKDGVPPGYELAENATFSGEVTQLEWPLKTTGAKHSFNPAHAAIVAAFAAPRIALRDPTSGHTVSIELQSATLQGTDLSKPIGIEFKGQVRHTQSAEVQPVDAGGRLVLSGQVADVFTESGQFNSDHLSIGLDARLQDLPIALVDQMFEMDGLIVATLGDIADVSLDSNLQGMRGPLNLQLRSANTTADIKTRLRAEGLMLTEPLIAETKVTEAFGKLVLGRINPIFETTQSAERPMRFEMPAEGVLVPIKDYDVSKVVIPRIELDLGTFTLKSGWLLDGTIGLAQRFGALKDSGRDQWTARFTPAILQLREGRAVYDHRLDLLLDERLHLATWGVADIGNNRAEFTLAFMPETLEKVFGLTVNPNDAFRIPVRGALDEPSVDFGKAGLELGRLQAQKQLTKKNKLLGAVAGQVTRAGAGSSPIPPASVDPLPWGPLPLPPAPTKTEQPGETAQPAESTAPENTQEQVIEGLFDLLRKKN